LSALVLDNSIVLAWCMADERHPLAEQAMELTLEQGAVVPGVWWYELRNALIVNERRGRLSAEDTRATLADLDEMNIAADAQHDTPTVLGLARRHELSVYDAAYLELALRRGLPLASLDRRLSQAATASGASWMTVE
jgi:predicted nucleic acid-binding protein